MKKKNIIIISAIMILIISFMVGTGFQKRTDVVLVDYSVSADGTEMNLGVQVSSSMGYIRGFKDKGGDVKPQYLTFYSTFGGLNSSFGAVNSFVLELGKNDTEIYFNRPNDGYELVLIKDEETGQWIRPKEDRMLSSYYPPEFMIIKELWGITLTTENVTLSGLTIKVPNQVENQQAN